MSITNDGDRHALALSYAEALGSEVAELATAGVSVIQLDEPCLVKYPSDLAIAREALSLVAVGKESAELELATYFGDAAPLYSQLQELPVDGLILDFTYSLSLPEMIETDGSSKVLGFGLIDGRNSKLEDKDVAARQVEGMLHRVTSDRCYLTTSCGLEYLPRDRAQLKLNHLTTVKNLILGLSE